MGVLARATERYRTEIHSFVLMSNHYHLVVSTPQRNLDLFMRYFQTESSRHIQRAAGRINHVFGGRYRWSILSTSQSVAYAYKYTLRNPVRAGVCNLVQDHQFGSLRHLLDFKNELPICERSDWLWNCIPRGLSQRLEWLNRPVQLEAELMIRLALRRGTFQFSRGNEVRNILETLHKAYGVDSYPPPFQLKSRWAPSGGPC